MPSRRKNLSPVAVFDIEALRLIRRASQRTPDLTVEQIAARLVKAGFNATLADEVKSMDGSPAARRKDPS